MFECKWIISIVGMIKRWSNSRNRSGAPGPAFGTWETTNFMARKRRLAAPQVLAYNFPTLAHNPSMNNGHSLGQFRYTVHCPLERGTPLPPSNIYFQGSFLACIYPRRSTTELKLLIINIFLTQPSPKSAKPVKFPLCANLRMRYGRPLH
jgi:hypothetical protein